MVREEEEGGVGEEEDDENSSIFYNLLHVESSYFMSKLFNSILQHFHKFPIGPLH